MKKALSLILALVLCLGLAAPALGYGEEYGGYSPTPAQQYADVPATHWAFKHINTCSERDWFNGYPDGTFRPEGSITREEAAKVFAVAMDLTLDDNPTPSFTDTANIWSTAYIEATKALFPNTQNLQGTTSFRPTKTITREETVYALVVAWKLASKTKNVDMSVLNMFSDKQTISAAVKPYIAVAVNEKLVAGLPDGTFGGQKGLSRAEFAALLARALNHGYGADDTSAPQITLDRHSSTTSEETITLTGKVEPYVTGTTLKVGAQKVVLSGDGAFSITLELDEGANSFTFTATNAYGNSSTKAVRVTYEKPEEPEQQRPSTSGGNNPSDTPSGGNNPGGTSSGGNRPGGASSGGNRPGGTTSGGNRPGDTTGGEDNPGGTTGGEDNPGGTTGGEDNPGDTTGGEDNPGGTTGGEDNPGGTTGGEDNPGGTTGGEDNPSDTPSGGDNPGDDQHQPNPARTVVDSGTSGRLAWTLYSDDDLVFAGSGEMGSYNGGNAPWYVYRQQVKTITIGDEVTSIGDCAFYECAVTQVRIPSSVTQIGRSAFNGCTDLTRVTIPDGVTVIHNLVFNGCTSLTQVTIPDGVTEICSEAFNGCSSLTQVAIPDSVTDIGSYAFKGCTGLTQVAIPNGVTNILRETFANCTSLTQVTIPDSVTDIALSAFEGCSGLAQVTIPNGVTSIGEKAFYKCSGLTQVTISDGVASIGNYAFGACSSLTQITIPGSVTSLGGSAFGRCSALQRVTILNGLSSLNDYTFAECHNLTEIFIPTSITNIGVKAFACYLTSCEPGHTDGLFQVNYAGTAAQWNAIRGKYENDLELKQIRFWCQYGYRLKYSAVRYGSTVPQS